jgi:hypothetical protein
MKKVLIFSSMVSMIFIYAFASPIIGGFSVNTPFLPLSTQPYSLYYYPGIGYEAGYGTSGNLEAGFGWNIQIPWMNFSQLPIQSNDLPVALSIAAAESAFQNYSVSSSGAQGLMQFMPTTAPAYGVQNPYDPFQSVTGALNYIKQYQKQFNSLQLAVAAYNGIPPYPETQAYVSEVMNYITQYSGSLTYPNIYARLGMFAQYDYNQSSNSIGDVTLGLAYPLPPGQMDICPEVTLNSTSANISWIWRVNLMNNIYFALNHSNTISFSQTDENIPSVDEYELSDTFGPLTAIVGSYTNGIAASGILNLWNQRIFGSISISGQYNYGISFHFYKIYVDLWSEHLPSSSSSYNISLNGRW